MPNATNAPNRPDYERDEYRDGQPARSLCHALMLGTKGVRALGKDGLPQLPGEEDRHYQARAKAAAVTRYYQRAVQASTGMIVATPPALGDDADETLHADKEDIDGKGTHFEVFAKYSCDDSINGGFVGILVDMPPIPEGMELRLDEEIALGIRPFWSRISADQIISWIEQSPDWATLLRDYGAGILTAEQVKAYAKQTVVVQVVIREPTDVRADDFGTKCVDRYRILTLNDQGVTFRVMEYREAAGNEGERFEVVSQGAMVAAKRQPLREIPLAVAYGGIKKAAFVADPPMLALAELNLDHHVVSSDRRYLMRICHAPTLVITGRDFDVVDEGTGQRSKTPLKVGVNTVLDLPEGATAKYIAADPKALDSSKEEKDEIVRAMATLGMSFLGKDRRGQQETATGRALDDAAENASHATVARGLQDGLEQAWRFHALYRGVTPPEVTVNTSYASPSVDPQIATVLWQAVAADKLDVDSWIEYIKTGSLPDDIAERLDLQRFVKQETDNATASAEAEAATQRQAAARQALDAQNSNPTPAPAPKKAAGKATVKKGTKKPRATAG